MSDFKNILSDYVNELYDTDDPSDMFSALEKAIKALGFDHVSYTFIPSLILSSSTACSPVFQLSDGYDVRFIQHYTEAGFSDHDYTVKSILNMDMSVKNWWEDADKRILSKQEKEVIEVAKYEYGIANGVTIPTYGDGVNVAGVSVSSADRSTSFSILYSEKINFIRKISIMYSDRVIGIPSVKSIFGLPFLSQLTTTEKKVLSMMAEGCNVQSIAHDLSLDYKYVANKIVSNIRKKMGGVSRDRMMYYAGNMIVDKIKK